MKTSEHINLSSIFTIVKKGYGDKLKTFQNTMDFKAFRDAKGKSLLHHAIEYNQLEIAKFLLEQEVEVNVKDRYGHTPLYYALRENIDYTNAIKLLVDFGADFSMKTMHWDKVFQRLICQSQFGILSVLVDFGVDVNVSAENGTSWLHKIIFQDSAHNVMAPCFDNIMMRVNRLGYDPSIMLIFFVDALKANINIQNEAGATPLHDAALLNNTLMVSLLLDLGANAFIRDMNDETPFQTAVYNNNFEAFKCFLYHPRVYQDLSFGTILAENKNIIFCHSIKSGDQAIVETLLKYPEVELSANYQDDALKDQRHYLPLKQQTEKMKKSQKESEKVNVAQVEIQLKGLSITH